MSKVKSNTPTVGYKLTEGYERYENYKCELVSKDLTTLTQYLEGVLLTLVDACISSKEQNTAMKSLVRKALWYEFYDMIQRGIFERQNGQLEYPLA